MRRRTKKAATKADNSSMWKLGLTLVIVVILVYIGYTQVPRSHAASQNTVTISRDASSLVSMMTVGGRQGVLDSVWRVNNSGINSVWLEGIIFHLRTSSGLNPNISNTTLKDNNGNTWGTAAPTPVPGQSGVYLLDYEMGRPTRLPGGNNLTWKIYTDLMPINGSTIRNDTRYYTTLDDSSDVHISASYAAVWLQGTTVPVYRYQLESYPTANSFIKNSAGDEIPLVVSKKTWLASLAVSAQPEKGVGFTRGISQNFIKFRVTSHVKDDGIDTGGWVAVDSATGKILQSSTDDIEGLTTINLEFVSNSLFVSPSKGAVISLYADTSAFEDKGDYIQVGLDGKVGNINWTLTNIPGGGRENFGHGDIIFRGNPSAQKLVKK